MSKVKTIITGIVLVLFAAFLGLSAFYYLKVKPTLTTSSKSKSSKTTIPKKIAAQPIKTPATKETPKPQTPAAPAAPVQKENAVTVQSLLKEAQKVYSPEESTKKEGQLWIDRKNSRYVVTLGALNGLQSGKQLGVFDGNNRVGQVIVDISFDVISYVHPSDESKDILSNDYYKVVIE